MIHNTNEFNASTNTAQIVNNTIINTTEIVKGYPYDDKTQKSLIMSKADSFHYPQKYDQNLTNHIKEEYIKINVTNPGTYTFEVYSSENYCDDNYLNKIFVEKFLESLLKGEFGLEMVMINKIRNLKNL